MSPHTIARPSYRALSVYTSGVAPCEVDLSDNTNLFGTPPAALAAVRASGAEQLTRYPTLYGEDLKVAAAAYLGVAPDEIVTGCGSDHVLDAAIRALAEPGDTLAYPNPTFSIIPAFATLNGLVPVPVPLREDHDLDADGLLATGARIIYLCSPNNPTGTLARPETIERVLERTPGVVILDEAYGEFVDRSWARAAGAHGRLLVTRTMSKAFGLAGLRVGYGVGAPALVTEVEKSRGPYTVTAPAERAAVAALREDVAWMRERVREAIDARERLVAALGAMGLAALPSAANFVFVPMAEPRRVSDALAARGVAVRGFSHLAGIGGGLRVTVGPWPMMERLVEGLREIRA